MTVNQKAALGATAFIVGALGVVAALVGVLWLIDSAMGAYGKEVVFVAGMSVILGGVWLSIYSSLRKLL